jgi:hypothetical protein
VATVAPEGTEPPQGPSREEILEAEVRELRQALQKDRKTAVADERLLQAIERALAAVPINPSVPPAAERADSRNEDAHHRQVLILSDFHGGEVVDPEVVNGANDYNWDIMLQRVDQVIEAALSHKRNSPDLTGLDVLFVGDMCSGSNHDELAVSNEFVLAEQGVRVGYLQAEILERLAPHYASLRALSVEGNHPRLSRKPAAKNPHDNMDWVASVITRERAKLIGVDVTVARGSSFWEVAGRTFYVWHGDGIRSTMPGVPWGGVMRRTNEIQSGSSKRIDHFVLGHFHQPNVVQGGRIIMNGALKGLDEWVLKQFGGGAPPCQLLLTLDEKKCRLTDVRFITPTAGLL